MREAYEKDPAAERVLKLINGAVEPVERELYRVGELAHPVAFIVGVPRTGTTLLSQVLCSTLDVGYIDHIAASFWRAPVLGIRLAAKLLDGEYHSSYASDFGRTHGLDEPHEFGYFWSERLGYAEPVEKSPQEAEAIGWDDLKRTLVNMSDAFGRPAVYKCFHIGWHMERMARLLPESLFLWIRRPPLETALSLLKMRREFLGSEAAWASFRPRGWEAWQESSPGEQVAAQVYHLEVALARQAARVADGQRLVLTYGDLCSEPGAVVHRVAEALGGLGERPEVSGPPPDPFPRRGPGEQDAAGKVGAALARWYDHPDEVEPWAGLLDAERAV